MKRIFHLSAALFLFLSSCLSEKNVEPGKPGTFVRYFNGGNNDFAQLAEETTEGDIIILGTTKVDAPALPADSSKIKLIKTNQYGKTLVQRLYPAFGSTTTTLTGSALLQLTTNDVPKVTTGFVIAGTEISTTPTVRRDLYLMQVDADLAPAAGVLGGKKIDFTVQPYNIQESVQAKAIQLNSNGNYLVLASVEADIYNMLLAEIDKNTFAINWVNKYGAGASSLSHKIFLDAASNVYWSGTVTRNSTDIRLVKTAQNSLNTIFDLPIGEPGFIEEGNDICQYGLGFIVVGTSNESGNQDILFKGLTNTGAVLFSTAIKGFGEDTYKDVDTGNAVCATNNGFIVLGSIRSHPGRIEGQDDYFLMKYDGFGNEAWPKPRIFGNTIRNDTGASVRQLSDGSLLVLGTTVFGGLRTIMLMKANSEGDIE